MNKFVILFILILLFVIIPVSSYSYIFKVNEPIDLRVSCFNESNYPCDASTDCYITVFRPDSTLLIEEQQMTRSNTYYNYSIDSTTNSIVGDHSSVVYCAGTTNAYSTFTYKITPSGEVLDEGLSNIYGGLLILLIILNISLLYVFFNIKNPFGKASILGFIYLITTGIFFIAWQISLNFLTITSGIPEIIYIFWRIFMWGTFPFLIGMFVWSLIQFKETKVYQSMMDRGLPEYEARGRVKRKRW